jgi:hypothetical protein
MRSFLTSPDLLKWVFSVAVPAISGFLGVVVGAWLTAETRPYFGELLKFVDIWDRWLAKSIPVEVVQSLGHTEASLQPFYDHLESKHDELRDHMSKGVL